MGEKKKLAQSSPLHTPVASRRCGEDEGQEQRWDVCFVKAVEQAQTSGFRSVIVFSEYAWALDCFSSAFQLGCSGSSLVVSGSDPFVSRCVSSVLQLCLFWRVCLQFLCYDLNLKQLRMVQKFSSVSLHTVGGGKSTFGQLSRIDCRSIFFLGLMYKKGPKSYKILQ